MDFNDYLSAIHKMDIELTQSDLRFIVQIYTMYLLYFAQRGRD